MTNTQARLIALPLVMIGGSLYSVVREEFALLLGGAAFILAGVFFIIEYNKSLYHFFRKNRGPLPALLILILRSLKAILYVVGGIPGALVYGRSRDRWLQDCRVLRWHLRGCPDDEGLARLREKSPDGGGT